MPIYEYRCHNCGFIFEEFQSIKADPAQTKCPKCGEQRSERLLSAFSSVNASGSGSVASSGGSCGSGGFT
ncbi:zinc ribbon domain-containing protein [candidate division KSB1 bacterium]|nr:zinc ribbon domain-containing protein [candidate division KSB1 bacterium]